MNGPQTSKYKLDEEEELPPTNFTQESTQIFKHRKKKDLQASKEKDLQAPKSKSSVAGTYLK